MHKSVRRAKNGAGKSIPVTIKVTPLLDHALERAKFLHPLDPVRRRIKETQGTISKGAALHWLIDPNKRELLMTAVEMRDNGIPIAGDAHLIPLSHHCTVDVQTSIEDAANAAVRNGHRCCVFDGELYAVDESDDHRKPLVIETGLPAQYLREVAETIL